jgi:predicted RNase H-like nuclease
MASARRLKEITEANNAAFSQAATEWWLAEAPSHDESPVAVAAAPSKPEEPKQDALVAVSAPTYTFATEGSRPEPAKASTSFNWLQSAPKETEKQEEIPAGPKMTWDAQNCCFVNG